MRQVWGVNRKHRLMPRLSCYGCAAEVEISDEQSRQIDALIASAADGRTVVVPLGPCLFMADDDGSTCVVCGDCAIGFPPPEQIIPVSPGGKA